ncbi:MAG: hypothetical protein ACFFD4_25040 [Candidatus Odinarchaeota archaeon]
MIIDEKQDFESLITRLPDYFLVQNFSETSGLKEIPDFTQGPLEENAENARKFLVDNFETLLAVKIKELRRLVKIVDLAGEWLPYKLKFPLTDLKNIAKMNSKSFPVSEFTGSSKTKVSGTFHVYEILDEIYVIAAEFKSRSALLRKTYRYLILAKEGILLAEALKGTKEILEKLLLPKLGLSSDNIKERNVNAMIVKKVARKFIPQRLTFLISIETAGVDGLTSISLEGDNVKRGLETLKSRQEFDLDPSNLGPWTAVETETVNVAVRKPVRVKRSQRYLELVQTLIVAFS